MNIGSIKKAVNSKLSGRFFKSFALFVMTFCVLGPSFAASNAAETKNEESQSNKSQDAIILQEDSDSALIKLEDYLPSVNLRTKTFVFPTQDGGVNGIKYNCFRKYLFNPYKNIKNQMNGSENGIALRFYDYMVNGKTKDVVYSHGVPVTAGSGTIYLNEADKNSNSNSNEFAQNLPEKTEYMSCSYATIDGDRTTLAIIPPAETAGKKVSLDGSLYMLNKKLYTVKTYSGTYKDCVSVISFGEGTDLDNSQANISYYAKGVGEVLYLKFDAENNRLYCFAEVIECQNTDTPEYMQPTAVDDLNFQPAGDVKEKIFRITKPTAGTVPAGALCYTKYTFLPEELSTRAIRRWQRDEYYIDKDAKTATYLTKQGDPFYYGVDFLQCENNNLVRFSVDKVADTQSVFAIIPPSETMGKVFQFEGIYYTLHRESFKLSTLCGTFTDCICVTKWGKTPNVYDKDSTRTFFAPDLGEVAQETYDPVTKKFQEYSNLHIVVLKESPEKVQKGAEQNPESKIDKKNAITK